MNLHDLARKANTPQFLKGFGRAGATAGITILSIVASMLLTSTLALLLENKVTMLLMLYAFSAPAIIAPVISWYVVGLLFKVHALEEQQRKLATFDSLTGVLNRRSYLERTEDLLEVTLVNRQALFVAILDIDNFKNINDTYGHACGDEVLISFSRVLSQSLRKGDVYGRIGGEEFAITLVVSGVDSTLNVLENLRAAVENDIVEYAGQQIRYTVSIGVSGGGSRDSQGLDDMIKHADEALYRAKSSGKNRIVNDDSDSDDDVLSAA